MVLKTFIQFGPDVRGQINLFRVDGNTVPDIFDQLDSLRNTQRKEFGDSWLWHDDTSMVWH